MLCLRERNREEMMGTIITRRRTALNNHPNLIIAIMAHLQPEVVIVL